MTFFKYSSYLSSESSLSVHFSDFRIYPSINTFDMEDASEAALKKALANFDFLFVCFLQNR